MKDCKLIKVECQICHKEFNIITSSHLKHHNLTMMEYVKRFPNTEIFNYEQRKIRSEKIKNNNNPSKRPEVREKMSNAKKGIYDGINNPNYGKHHSIEAKQKMSLAKEGKYKGENCWWAWKGGTSFLPYCHKFNNSLRNEVRKRDDYICQYPDCLHTQLESLMIYQQSLHVHHIHYDKENCNKLDLITLCNSCNVKANFNRDYWEELYMNLLERRKLLDWKPRNIE